MTKFEEELSSLPVSKSTNYTEYWNKAQLLSVFKDWQPQQALPVVKDFVAEWYEEHKDDLDFSVFEACVSLYDDNSNDFKKWFGNSENKSIETLIRMKDGFTVEKPQLFYLKHIDMSKADKECDWYLITDCVKLCHEWVGKNLKPKDDDFKFTQQEIDSMQTGSYELVPVEDGE
ncbi:DUF1642 domain-containing protein [Lactococcus lactis]|uniref:DUF1642 domain-containing protein n=1 Tax=Lactococcus lactis TaxID=1358 RepID=UPI001911D997|nr:DUF1642 domain-containing protein [Lactococcus lactis]MBK5077062.1 DUF1642 domain-containing protein [Lactococcus lactis]